MQKSKKNVHFELILYQIYKLSQSKWRSFLEEQKKSENRVVYSHERISLLD